MTKGSLLEIAYDFLKANHRTFSFKDIWSGISSVLTPNDDIEYLMGELYTDLVLDNRFALTEDGDWALSDYVDTKNVKKNYDSSRNSNSTEDLSDENTQDIFDDSDTQDNIMKTKENLNKDHYVFDEDDLDDEDFDDEDDEDEYFDDLDDEDSY